MPRRKAKITKRKHVIPKLPVSRPLHLRFERRQTVVEKLANALTSFFGTLTFLLLNIAFFTFWISWNLGAFPSLAPIDPYPFGMLTMVVSLEAIVLTIVVLISQNRANKIADAREEVALELEVASERQVAAIMQSLDLILHHLQINHLDDMQAMQEVNVEKLERRVVHEIDTD